jgi:GNAT superfamily N-acetyltransferase
MSAMSAAEAAQVLLAQPRVSAIRIASVKGDEALEASLLLYLQLKCLPHDQPLESDSGFWWIAYEGELAVAFAAMSQSHRWTDTGYLSRSGVLPSHRGQGLQKRLLRVRERKARSLGWNWLITDTWCNPASSNSLISCGFRLFEPSHPWGLPDALYWRKALT